MYILQIWCNYCVRNKLYSSYSGPQNMLAHKFKYSFVWSRWIIFNENLLVWRSHHCPRYTDYYDRFNVQYTFLCNLKQIGLKKKLYTSWNCYWILRLPSNLTHTRTFASSKNFNANRIYVTLHKCALVFSHSKNVGLFSYRSHRRAQSRTHRAPWAELCSVISNIRHSFMSIDGRTLGLGGIACDKRAAMLMRVSQISTVLMANPISDIFRVGSLIYYSRVCSFTQIYDFPLAYFRAVS